MNELLTVTAPAILQFLITHWDTIAVIITAVVTALQVISAGQYQSLWPLALDSVRKVADLQISGPEKRTKAVDTILATAPALTKIVPRTLIEKMTEQAYQFLRGELKQVERKSVKRIGL